MPVIKESYVLTADNTDILAAGTSRLASIPASGVLTIEASATDSDVATNFGTITLQLPNGETPFENLLVPANGYSTADVVMHDDTAVQVQMEVEQGGHVTLSYDETGTVLGCLVFVTFDF